jgi:hypothetical protein
VRTIDEYKENIEQKKESIEKSELDLIELNKKSDKRMEEVA